MIHDKDNIPVLVGYMNKEWGLNGFEQAMPGHPVFEMNERYIIYLKSRYPLTEKVKGEKVFYESFMVCVPFYRDTLKQAIDFI